MHPNNGCYYEQVERKDEQQSRLWLSHLNFHQSEPINASEGKEKSDCCGERQFIGKVADSQVVHFDKIII